jgi:hypothetical protein
MEAKTDNVEEEIKTKEECECTAIIEKFKGYDDEAIVNWPDEIYPRILVATNLPPELVKVIGKFLVDVFPKSQQEFIIFQHVPSLFSYIHRKLIDVVDFITSVNQKLKEHCISIHLDENTVSSCRYCDSAKYTLKKLTSRKKEINKDHEDTLKDYMKVINNRP